MILEQEEAVWKLDGDEVSGWDGDGCVLLCASAIGRLMHACAESQDPNQQCYTEQTIQTSDCAAVSGAAPELLL